MLRQSERNVVFGHIEKGQEANTTVRQVLRDKPITEAAIANAIPKFVQVRDFTTFSAEYAMQDSNLIVHFFLPPDHPKMENYWTLHFPAVLDATARSYFSAESPRLQAKYTEEVGSWWFRARGYDHIIDLKSFVDGFFEQLDRALEVQA